MSAFNRYLGRPYIEGLQDCYQICRDYYSDEHQIELPNLARPSHFWEDPNLDLYGMYERFGFRPVFDKPFEIGDAMLMPILTPVNSHAAVYVADNRILHHLVGQLSSLEPLRPKWFNRVTIHLRHPDVKQPKPEVINLHEVLDADILRNPRVQAEIERQMGSNS